MCKKNPYPSGISCWNALKCMACVRVRNLLWEFRTCGLRGFSAPSRPLPLRTLFYLGGRAA